MKVRRGPGPDAFRLENKGPHGLTPNTVELIHILGARKYDQVRTPFLKTCERGS